MFSFFRGSSHRLQISSVSYFKLKMCLENRRRQTRSGRSKSLLLTTGFPFYTAALSARSSLGQDILNANSCHTNDFKLSKSCGTYHICSQYLHNLSSKCKCNNDTPQYSSDHRRKQVAVRFHLVNHTSSQVISPWSAFKYVVFYKYTVQFGCHRETALICYIKAYSMFATSSNKIVFLFLCGIKHSEKMFMDSCLIIECNSMKRLSKWFVF